ncbi:RDD family protein [Streptomyces sp. NBC_01233]|uniref:RDD family protein n=1 Tax=Streptomyces sp. NBC_01233 TaxID=2903787 RepID=UPI002E1257F7|nr:RDD family protein [Streptomyces sp. NBC_01233]
MSTDQPPPGEPPEEDPFRKKPQEPTPPPGGSPYGAPPPGSGGAPPPPGGPGAGGYPPPPPPYGGGDPYGGGSGMPDPLAGMPPLADTGKRIVARIIDWLVVGIPVWLVWFLLVGFSVNWDMGDADAGEDVPDAAAGWYNGAFFLWLLIAIVAYIAYDWYFNAKSGRTLGKKAMGLRVAMLNDGRVPPSKSSLGRACALWLPCLVPCCGGLWWIVVFISILVDKPYQQGLHDKAAKTVVVQST